MTETYKHWKIETDAVGICWLHFDKADSSANVLSAETLSEFDGALDEVVKSSPKGLVILSDKPAGFIAGADVHEFVGFESETAALEQIRYAHSVFNKLESLPFTTIALINGYCLGGGLELALACNYRIIDDEMSTRIGLPEIQLGIHPGFGGTVRSIKLVGVLAAMNMMLTGRAIASRAAKKIGLVDYSIPQRHFINAAKHIILNPAKTSRKLSILKRLASHKYVRSLVAKILSKKVAKKAKRTHYPAPYALIDLWQQHFDDPAEMFEQECQSVARLITSKTAQNLIRVFKLRETLKGLGSLASYNPKHIHVIGGGVMGGDIAAWCALNGFKVTIQDQKAEALGNVIKRAYKLVKRKRKIKRSITEVMDRLIPDPKGRGLKAADIIIEAVFEDTEVKRTLFKSIEHIVKKDAILATNTSSIPLDEISSVLKDPSRLVGIHFFNPVAMMPLVEIVQSTKTQQDVIDRAFAFTKKISRLPLPVTSTPGFLVNRVLMPYLMEAVILASENVPLSEIDKAAVDFGMPMGPIELADTVGLDICMHVAQNLAKDLPIEVPEMLSKLVDAGSLGKKTGRGFYEFKKGVAIKPPVPNDYKAPVDLADRLILRMLNEAVLCLQDKVIDNKDYADAGIIFGTGFAPFRGGPFHYIENRGAKQLVKMLEHMNNLHGGRFKANEGWDAFT